MRQQWDQALGMCRGSSHRWRRNYVMTIEGHRGKLPKVFDDLDEIGHSKFSFTHNAFRFRQVFSFWLV